MFSSYKNITQDKNAKTLSFNISDEFAVLDTKLLNELKKIGQKINSTVRISLHKDSLEQLHNMVIYSKNTQKLNIHKHIDKVETYHIIEGEILIILFDDDGNIDTKVLLSKDDILMCRVPKNIYHLNFVVGEYAIFHETRRGPFISSDSIVPEWIDDIDVNIILK